MNSTDKISHNRNIHKKEGFFMSEETDKIEETFNETEVPANETDGAENLGSVNISDDVISVVVGMTLSEIRGICPSGSNFGNIAEMFSGKRNMGKGVKVEVNGESVSMDLHIIVEYGIKIPDVAWEAQEKVKEAVESITGLSVDKVNIHAQKRGANIICEIVGYGSTDDAYHITSPAPDGEGAQKAMEFALKDANLTVDDVTYINAHGTSTDYNDKFETAAIKGLFGDKAKNVAVSSTKSMMGHLLGAAGAVEAIICALSIRDGFIPATINYETPDEECDLDYVPNVGREQEVPCTMSNSLGFGGHNATIVMKKYEK